MDVTCPSCGTSLPAGFKFCSNCGHKVEAAPPPSRDERRDVSVMFADVSGFTAMSEKLDPEHVHSIMNACFDGLGAAIQSEGGHIDKYIGDNVMALFGAPVAHEDDPRRAGRAALAMQGFLAGFGERNKERAGVTLRMRIGIHCGLVLAGNVGASVRRDYSVMGDAVNLASRLESSARPGGILVSEEFMRRTRGQFAFGPVNALKVKGKSEPVQAYELLRELTEIEAGTGAQAEFPFAGRRSLIEQIAALWSGRSKQAPWIQVSGPAGIGKTRLVEAAEGEAGVRLVRVTARPSTRHRPLALARRIIQSVAAAVTAVDAGSSAPESFDAFAERLAPVAGGLEAYMGALWYLAAPDHVRVAAPDPDPQTLRRTLQFGFARLLSNLAAFDADAVVFADNFDYADAASAELLEHLPETGSSPPPVIVTLRAPGAAAARKWHAIEVPPLPAAEVEALLDGVEYARGLPPGLRANLIERAGGVPLYIEEMILKLLAEGVIYRAGGGWTCRPDASAAMLPESLFGTLVARADALAPPLRQLLMECAVQGVEFSSEVAREIMRAAAGLFAQVDAHVLDLGRQHLIDSTPYRSGYWSFRQSLMQSACYETLLISERKRLHQQTAQALGVVAGGPASVSPTVLAHHFESAESWLEAAAANFRAGERSAEVFGNEEAAARYARAIEQAGRAGGTEAEGIAVEALDGAARLHLRLGAYEEVERLAKRLLDLATAGRGRALGHRHFAAACFHTGRMESAREHLLAGLDAAAQGVLTSELLFDLAQLELRAARLTAALEYAAKSRAMRDPSDRAAGIRLDLLDGRLAHTQGRFEDAVAHYTHALGGANRLGSVSEQARACNYMGDASRDKGDYGRAQQFFAQALAMWERIGDAEGVAGAHNNLANLAMSRGDLGLAGHHHRRALEAFEGIGNVHGSALSRANLAILAIENGEAEEAIEHARRGLALLGDGGAALLRALTEVVLGEGHLLKGAIDTAEQAFCAAVAGAGEALPPLVRASAERGLGRVALARGLSEEALKRLASSLEGFRKIGRAQEAARTLLFIAEAQRAAGDTAAARDSAVAARRQFLEIGAGRDAERAEALLAGLK